MKKNGKLVKEWLAEAHEDERGVISLTKHKDASPSLAGFHVHQMTEKYLKAFLLKASGEFPKIHFIDRLLTLCGKYETDFLKFPEAGELLDDYYFVKRYPGEYPEATWKDVQAAYAVATRIRNLVLKKIKA